MNRTAVLNLVAEIIDARSYLEIGIFDPRGNFDQIRCPEKLGVDPAVDTPRVAKTTSDLFFAGLDPGQKWDLIFVDGDHRRVQVERDVDNALCHLADDGVLVLHDVDPADEAAAAASKPSASANWSGEAWKVLVERVRARDDLRSVTVDTDHGVALVLRGHDPAPLAVPGSLDFAWLQENRQHALALISAEPAAIRRFLGRASVVYYTHNQAARSIRRVCFERLRQSARGKELIVVAQDGEDFFAADHVEIVGRRPPSHFGLYRQMLQGLELARHDTVFLAEDDVLYPPGYFDFQVPDRFRFHYNTHVYCANREGYSATDVAMTSNGTGDRDLLALAVRQRLRHIRSGGTIEWAEPGIGGHDDFSSAVYRSPIPTVDVRHGRNFTGYRDGDEISDRIDHWGSHSDLAAELGLGSTTEDD